MHGSRQQGINMIKLKLGNLLKNDSNKKLRFQSNSNERLKLDSAKNTRKNKKDTRKTARETWGTSKNSKSLRRIEKNSWKQASKKDTTCFKLASWVVVEFLLAWLESNLSSLSLCGALLLSVFGIWVVCFELVWLFVEFFLWFQPIWSLCFLKLTLGPWGSNSKIKKMIDWLIDWSVKFQSQYQYPSSDSLPGSLGTVSTMCVGFYNLRTLFPPPGGRREEEVSLKNFARALLWAVAYLG